MQPFPDYGFKLVVLDELLENGSFVKELETLKSTPEIALKIQGWGDEESFGETIPEMDAFFRAVEITEDDLLKITSLCFDGGNAIYHLIRPFWDGEDGSFDVLSVDGFEQLKNLQSVFNNSMISEGQIGRLEKAGIRID